MKKTILSLFMFALIFTAGAVKLSAQGTVVGHANAEVVASLSANEITQLNFGRFSPTGVGTIKVTPGAQRTASGLVTLAGSTFSQGIFEISGTPAASISVVLPTSTTIAKIGDATKTMAISAWESTPASTVPVSLGATGTVNLNIGATLTVGDLTANPLGKYTGTFNVTFSYN